MTPMQKSFLLCALGALTGLVFGGMVGYIYGFDAGLAQKVQPTDVFPGTVSSFDDCILAGNPVMESYPRQCRDELTGKLFVEEIAPPVTATSSTPVSPATSTVPTKPMPAAGCMVGGCSGQLCGESSEMEGLVSTCEFRAEYACYKQSRCERQTSGKCGWTQTKELMACLANPPALQ